MITTATAEYFRAVHDEASAALARRRRAQWVPFLKALGVALLLAAIAS
jgi:hypothetical protein